MHCLVAVAVPVAAAAAVPTPVAMHWFQRVVLVLLVLLLLVLLLLRDNASAKKYKKRHSRTRKVGEMSFAQRVRRGGRKKEAMEAYRRGALVDLFVVMDKDMSGRVDEFELTHFLTTLFCSEGKKLGDAEVRQIELMIAGLDEDGTYI